MSHFYASIQGTRGEATRCGDKSNGIHGHIRGWDVGVYIAIEHINGEDVIKVYKTGGSNGGKESLILAFTKERFL